MDAFTENTLYNATLYVPEGTIEKYKKESKWSAFLFIEEETDNNEITIKKCENPTISIDGSCLIFNCTTSGVTYHYSISDSDMKSGTMNDNEIELTKTYHISVYATKDGYEDSDIVTKEIKLCDNTGDMNGDKKVDAADVVKLVNIIMTQQSN